MLNRLVVHIGANKTGSSAIQRFLALNHAALREDGFLVPDATCGLGNQITGFQVFWFQELLTGADGPARLAQAVDAVDRQETGAHTLLLSAENLAANPAAPQLFEQLAGRYPVQVLLYVRRQDEYLLSSWQQWYSKQSSDFWAWLVGNLGGFGNWAAYLRRWEEVVPRERIAVRVFEPARLAGGDAVRDFLAYLGVERPYEQFRQPKGRINPSFTDAVTDLVAGNPAIFDGVHDNEFYSFVQKMTGGRFLKKSRESAITHEQRQAIVKFYSPSNAWVRDAYFPESRRPLFALVRKDDYDFVPQETREKQKLELLVSLLYGMYKEGKA